MRTRVAIPVLLLSMSLSVADSSAEHQIDGILTAAPDIDEQRTFKVAGDPYSLDIRVAASAEGDDSLEQGVYLFHLKCSADVSCVLERLTLNECANDKNGNESFLPRIDTWSTVSGRLEVKQRKSDQVELTIYQAFGSNLPARIYLTFAQGERPLSKVSDFRTEGFIDLRYWPNIDIGIEYFPLQSDRLKTLDCPILLPGLN